MAEPPNLRATAARIETLVRDFGALPDPRVRHKAEEIVRLLMELYGAGLSRILDVAAGTMDEAAGGREKFFERLTEDSLVTSLLVLHELHPHDTLSRITGALERVRPYLASHGGNVILLGMEEQIVHLRMEGNCQGCPSSGITMKLAIEKSIQEAAPEVERIEVEGATQPAETRGRAPADDRLSGKWIALSPLPAFNANNLAAAELSGTKLILCRVGETLYAYEDTCPCCGASFLRATLRDEILLCTACHKSYDTRRAGRCTDNSGFHLEPLPLLAEDHEVRVSIPTDAG